MNVFEDLVVELKEENLLEETVIDRSGGKTNGSGNRSTAKKIDLPDEPKVSGQFDFDVSSFDNPDTAGELSNLNQRKLDPDVVRRRLSDRMSALQSVEYVLTAIEANFSSASNTPFDDLSIKKAFHVFEQACSEPDSNEYFESESILISQMDAWEETLKARDQVISVDALRQFAESANPPLSPQTLFALIRFYWGIEFSEATRAKFDAVSTRLFSKFVDGERRDLLCPRGEIARHFNQRYLDWSGGQYRKTDTDDPNIALQILSFDDFISEAMGVSKVGEMLANKFFERICEFKKGAGEIFMVPEVSAAVIECNIAVANKIIDLVSAEVERNNGSASIKASYAGLDKPVLSDAVARTLNIDTAAPLDASVNNERSSKPGEARASFKPKERRSTSSKPVRRATRAPRSTVLGVNRWLLLATILTVVVSIGIYGWSWYSGSNEDEVSSSTARTIDLEKPELKQYVKVSRVSGNMLYAIVTPEYEKLDVDGQHDYLQKILQAGSTKGYTKVSLINQKGRSVGYASADRIETAQK